VRSESEIRARLERVRRIRDDAVKRGWIELIAMCEKEIATLLWVLEEV